MRWLWVALAAAGCDGRTGITDGPGECHDHLDEVEYHEECYGVDGIEGPGAARYFVGEYAQVGVGEYEGWEYWVLMTNPAWQGTGQVEEMCLVVWQTWAVEGDPVGCATCDFSLAVDAYFDAEESDCPPGVEMGFEQFSEVYDVRVDDDGSVWYFSASGKQFATGTASDDCLTFISEPSCIFF